MSLKIMKLRKANKGIKAKAGDLVLVETNYDWDSDKVILICVLRRGSDLERSEYKVELNNVTDDEIWEYLRRERP